MFIVGVGQDFQQIPFMYASFREIDIRFQYQVRCFTLFLERGLRLIIVQYRETYPKAIMLVAEGLINLKPLVTHRYRLEDARDAFFTASTPAAKAVKVQLLDD